MLEQYSTSNIKPVLDLDKRFQSTYEQRWILMGLQKNFVSPLS